MNSRRKIDQRLARLDRESEIAAQGGTPPAHDRWIYLAITELIAGLADLATDVDGLEARISTLEMND